MEDSIIVASNAHSDLDVPIALRKPKRRSEAISSVKSRATSDSLVHAKTPSTRRSKRVRFSDPGLFSPTSNISSTSLTPAFRRSSLGTPRQRRPATPARHVLEGSIQFTPLTDILDERCQRRIRRNGLSDEMNQYEADKKTKASLQKEIDEKDTELQRLRAELDAAKAQPVPQVDTIFDPPVSSQQRVDEIEAELDILRQSFAEQDDGDFDMQSESVQPVQPMQPLHSWAHVPRTTGPSSDSGDTILIHVDDDADMDPDADTDVHYPSHQPTHSDALRMGLELQAAKAAKSTLLDSFRNHNNASFEFHFADSPAHNSHADNAPSPTPTLRIPDTPPTLYHDLAKDLKATTNRAEQAELTLTALDIEITALGFGDASTDDSMAMITAIATHFRTARLELERLVPGESVAGLSDNAQILPELLRKLKFLSERLRGKEEMVRAAGDLHKNLKGNFEKAIIAAEKANETVKKLENALDKSVEETLHVRMRGQELERELEGKERDVESLGKALDRYRGDITRLEGLVNELQGERDGYGRDQVQVEELQARVASETTGRRAAEISAVKRLARINELEGDLAMSRRKAVDLEEQLASLQNNTDSSDSEARLEVQALNVRIASLAGALAFAESEVEKLKVTKVKLEDWVRGEVERGAAAVETLQEQLVRSVVRGNEARKRYVNGAKVRIANWELEVASSDGADGDGEMESEESGVRTPGSVRFAEWAEVETIEGHEDQDIQQDQSHDQDLHSDPNLSGSESVPGSIQVNRGRSRYRKKPRLVSFDQARRSGAGLGIGQDMKMKRRYDSGIGMDEESEFGDEEGERVVGTVVGGVRGIGGMMTPELSSEGDVEKERESVR